MKIKSLLYNLYGTACLFMLLCFTSCGTTANLNKSQETVFERAENNPIIRPDMEGLEGVLGKNINGPRVIKAPNWVENPLGK